MLRLESLCHIVDKNMVEVIASEVSVAIGRFNLEYAVAQLQDRDIECTTTEVVHGNLHILILLIHTVSQRSRSRLVDDTAHLQTCNLTSLLRSLTLRVGEVCRNGDNSLCYLLTEIVLGGLLHLLQDDSRDLLWSVLTTVNLNTRSVVCTLNNRVWSALHIAQNLVVLLAHKTLDREYRALRVCDSLTLCRIAHLALAAIGKGNDRRGCAVSLRVRNNNGLRALHNGNTRVCCTKVNTNNLSHSCNFFYLFIVLLFLFCFVLFSLFCRANPLPKPFFVKISRFSAKMEVFGGI